jgi:geranylgeranyl pyrophosphate synthase
MKLRKIFHPIKEDLDKSVEMVKTQTDDVVDIIFGKNIRGGLFLLSSYAKDYQFDDHHRVNLCTAIELIHLASLIHDDICDHSEIRRGKSTVYSEFGSEYAVAAGDILLSKAAVILSESAKNKTLFFEFSKVLHSLAKGQLIQIKNRKNHRLSKEKYFEIIGLKTSSLFKASMMAGGWYNGKQDIGLGDFGFAFGNSFQIIDDIMDIMNTKKDKDRFQNLDNMEMTLPIIYAMENNNSDEIPSKNEIIDLMGKSGIKSKIRVKCENDLTTAMASIEYLKDSNYKKSLFELKNYILKQI